MRAVCCAMATNNNNIKLLSEVLISDMDDGRCMDTAPN